MCREQICVGSSGACRPNVPTFGCRADNVADMSMTFPAKPMNHDEIDRGHQHRCGHRNPHSRCCGAHHHRDGRAVEDSVCQAEEGVVQMASRSAPSHLSYSSSSVASIAADAAADTLVIRSSGPSRMMVGAAVPPELPLRRTHPDSGDRDSRDGSGKNGVGGCSSTDRDNDDLRC